MEALKGGCELSPSGFTRVARQWESGGQGLNGSGSRQWPGVKRV